MLFILVLPWWDEVGVIKVSTSYLGEFVRDAFFCERGAIFELNKVLNIHILRHFLG